MANKNAIIKNRNGDNCFPYTFDFNVFTANYERLSDIIPNLVPKILTIAGINLSGNISASDLKNALINSSSKLSTDLLTDGTTNKVFTATEKTKLSGIETGAQVNPLFETNTSNIKMNGSVSVGILNTVARADHIHPSDTSKQNLIDSSHKLSADLVDDASTTNKFVSASDKEIWNGKQNATDNSLDTVSKTIVGAINEVNSKTEGRTYTKEYNTISAMVTALNAMDSTTLKAGDNIFIVETDVPDLWVGKVESSVSTYTFVDNATFVNAITGDLTTTVQVGYYRLCKLETQKVDLTGYLQKTSTTGLNRVYAIYSDGSQGIFNVDDGLSNWSLARRNGSGNIRVATSPTNSNDATSKDYVDNKIVALSGTGAPTTSTVGFIGQVYIDTTNNKTYQCVAKTTESDVTTHTWTQLIRATDYATTISVGVVKVGSAYGTTMADGNKIAIWSAQTTDIDAKTSSRKPVVPNNLDYAVKVGVTTNVNTLTDTEKTNACTWLGTGKMVKISQSDYDDLVDADTVDINTYYFIEEE